MVYYEGIVLSAYKNNLIVLVTVFIKLHTSDLNDGVEWGRLNLNSVTEQSNLDDFLTTAELAGTEFTAGNNPVYKGLIKSKMYLYLNLN